MKVVVIGATGTIGKAVVEALAPTNDVVRVSRHGDTKADLQDIDSLRRLFAPMRDLDAVIVCAGSAAFAPLEQLTDENFAFSLRDKLMGQVNVVRTAKDHVRDGGSITLTSGILAQHPIPGSAAFSLVNAGVEAFARAAALEIPRLRINVVSPPWVTETLVALKMDPSQGMPAAKVARAYLHALEAGLGTGQTIDARKFA